jgi:hypothetical protein
MQRPVPEPDALGLVPIGPDDLANEHFGMKVNSRNYINDLPMR